MTTSTSWGPIVDWHDQLDHAKPYIRVTYEGDVTAYHKPTLRRPYTDYEFRKDAAEERARAFAAETGGEFRVDAGPRYFVKHPLPTS